MKLVDNFGKDAEKYGFRWGPLVVMRCCSDKKRLGYILQIKTIAGKVIEIRVSPAGTAISCDIQHRP